MGANYIPPAGNADIQDFDVLAIAAKIRMGVAGHIFYSYTQPGQQILEMLKNKMGYILTPNIQFYTYFDKENIYIRDLDKVIFSYHVIEVAEKHFAAVILSGCPIRNKEDKATWDMYINKCAMTSFYVMELMKIDNCAKSNITIEKRNKPFEPVGFYFENDELANLFREAKALKYPYETTLQPGNYSIPDWYKNKIRPATPASANTSVSNTGGCYIATAVYGSYDCPQVWVLRRFRDFSLAQSRPGRAFIKAYYTVSPSLVKSFGRCKWFQNFWRKRLDKLVDKLKARGYEDTNYYD